MKIQRMKEEWEGFVVFFEDGQCRRVDTDKSYKSPKTAYNAAIRLNRYTRIGKHVIAVGVKPLRPW